MFRLLFWNLHAEPRALELAEHLCETRAIDLFIAAEVPSGVTTLKRSSVSRLSYSVCRKGLHVEEVAAYEFAMALRVRSIPACGATPRDLTVVGVHLRSRLSSTRKTSG